MDIRREGQSAVWPNPRPIRGRLSEAFNSLNNWARLILVLGILWGVVAFLMGLAASFTAGRNDGLRSLLLFVCGFLGILPVSIAAIRRPRMAAILVLISFFIVEIVLFSEPVQFTHRGMINALLFFGVPDAMLILGYAYVARVKDRMDADLMRNRIRY
jgi:hypothetical protein